jgi:hypothetical protein
MEEMYDVRVVGYRNRFTPSEFKLGHYLAVHPYKYGTRFYFLLGEGLKKGFSE